MKLRLQFNSIRLRLKRGEIAQLAKLGAIEETIIMGGEPQDIFRYVLESSAAVSTLGVHLRSGGVLVQVPAETLIKWATGNEVGIEARLPVGNQGHLHVLIEKDFACLEGTEEENADTFPNPLAGTKC
jgi:hypothetical protein